MDWIQPLASTLGPAGVIAIFIIWNHYKNKKNHSSNNPMPESATRAMEQVANLYQSIENLKTPIYNSARKIEWLEQVHSKTDANGLFNWYVPRSWKKDIDDLKELSGETNNLLIQILNELRSKK